MDEEIQDMFCVSHWPWKDVSRILKNILNTSAYQSKVPVASPLSTVPIYPQTLLYYTKVSKQIQLAKIIQYAQNPKEEFVDVTNHLRTDT